MRFAIVAAGAVVLGATVAEARSVASSPRRHVERVMKRSNAHETRVEIERINFTPSRLSKRSKLADEDWTNTASSDETDSTHDIDSSLHVAASDHKNNKIHSKHRKDRVTSSQRARTVVSNPSDALPNNVVWTIEKKKDEESSKSGASQFTITPILPGGKSTKERKAAQAPEPSITGAEYMIIPVNPIQPTAGALPAASPITELLEHADPMTAQANDLSSTTTLLRAIENYREAVAEQAADSEETAVKADLPLLSNQKSRASKHKSSKSTKASQKDEDNCDSESENTSSDFDATPTDFRTVQTDDVAQ
ncbi:hypothetical protein PtB15_1B304 [Puccinia triticina]|nr:hypothetical protein PtB15_1B304 [Puccinia triticina]